jgi:SAM-dependent methyltransferase
MDEIHGVWSLYECRSCGVQHFWPPKNPGSEWYERKDMYVFRDLMLVDWPEWYHKEALRRLPNRGSLIDVGCGTGVFVAEARRRGYDAVGVDFSEQAIAAGKQRFGLENLYCVGATELHEQFRGRKFDIVTAFEVLEHMDDVARFMGELEHLVKPGGYIVISVPNRDRVPRILGEGDTPPHHFTRWNRDALVGLMRRRGLDVESVSVCPAQIGLRNLLMYNLRSGLLVRFARRSDLSKPGVERDVFRTHAHRLTIAKERAASMVSLVLAPLLPFLRGPLMLAIARKPSAARN